VHGTIHTLDELARRLLTSDAAAFTEIYQRLEQPLVRYVHGITDDTGAAYVVLQEVFMKLWQDRETLTVHASIKALLYTMARNRALNMRRRKAWFAEDADVATAQDHHAAVPAGDAALLAKDLADRLHQWIQALPPHRAEAFILSRYHGLKHSEISNLMGLSERTVNTHILRALRDLRARYDALQRQG
jgi:RNA polymerase sigma-70 factor (family 1)